MSDHLPDLVDTHAHLDSGQFRDDLNEVLQRASDAAIQHIITIGCDLESSRKSVELAHGNSRLSAAVGIHPHDAGTLDDSALDELRELASDNKVVAIGEIGLDYYRNRSPRDVQRAAFRAQLRLARELHLPVIIHDRDAHNDVVRILREEKIEEIGGVMHCFSGDVQLARTCIDMGLHISFAGPLTYPKNKELRAAARSVPTEYLLVETDCPYLSPQPWRGKRNEPARVRATAEVLAETRGLSLADIARITNLNAFRLFGIGQVDQTARIAYVIRNSLYLNITNRCTNRCRFCAKFRDFQVKGHQLRLDREPDYEDVMAAIGDAGLYDEVVFCGYGEPLLRLDLVKQVAARLKKQGVRIRVNTDGQANLVHGRNILPELQGLVDAVSVSLNAADAATYQHWCQSDLGEAGFEAIKDFLRLAPRYIPEVTASAVTLPGLDIEACRQLALELGVGFRAREYNELG